jgi:hypothetical protein
MLQKTGQPLSRTSWRERPKASKDPALLDHDHRRDHRPDRQQVEARHHEQNQPARYPEGVDEARSEQAPEDRHHRGDQLAGGGVLAPAPHVAHQPDHHPLVEGRGGEADHGPEPEQGQHVDRQFFHDPGEEEQPEGHGQQHARPFAVDRKGLAEDLADAELALHRAGFLRL